MGTRYTGRPKSSNKNKITTVRLLDWQREKLEEYSNKYDMKLSDIVREAITIWINMNSKGAS